MLSKLSYVARAAIKDYCSAHNLSELCEGSTHDAQSCAWLYFLLRQAPDYAEWFPRGKWATLQVLEASIDEQAKVEAAQLTAEKS